LSETQPEYLLCEACGKDAECGIWGHHVCYRCAADFAKHAPTYGDIEKKYGAEANPAAVYRQFTERWLAARKGRAA